MPSITRVIVNTPTRPARAVITEHKITMKDVAEAASVSTATVGRVLHGRGYVSGDARERVEEAILRTGFRLNMVAQSLRRSRSMTIGHLLTSIVPNSFFAGIELGVEQEAIRHGYNVLIWNVLSDPAREREGVEAFIRRQMDAIIFTTPLDPANVELARQVSPAEQIKELTANKGADVAIEASGYYTALNEAIRSVAYSAKVVALGFFQGTGQGLYLGEKFHHNRVNVICSQIFGVSPELTYRWNVPRLVAAAMRMQADGVLNLRPIITQVYPFSEADEAFRKCDYESEQTIQVVLDFTR